MHIKNLVFADSFMESSSYNEFELQLPQVSSGENTLSCNHAVEENGDVCKKWLAVLVVVPNGGNGQFL